MIIVKLKIRNYNLDDLDSFIICNIYYENSYVILLD